MVDSGELVASTLKREFGEEEAMNSEEASTDEVLLRANCTHVR